MGDTMVNDILNMFKSDKPLKIGMPDPTRIANTPNFSSKSKSKIRSETEYAEEYKTKDDEEYLQVMHIFNILCMCNNVTWNSITILS